MKTQLNILGCSLVTQTLHKDERGTFQRIADNVWIPGEPALKQISVSYNPLAHTLRGVHFQKSKETEFKIVTVLSGSIYDVIIDLRKESESYLKHQSLVIKAEDRRSLVIPPGVAHGFMTLEPNSIVHYSMTSKYEVSDYSGIRWNDPIFSIDWPFNPVVISQQDQNWPDL
jgi:dTDP-4-dehydrorhamnose 3,5-epimerase